MSAAPDLARSSPRPQAGVGEVDRPQAETEGVLPAAEAAPAPRGRMPMWIIYDHPDDHPHGFIAKRWLALPVPELTGETVEADDAEDLRRRFRLEGLTRLPRDGQDARRVLECWL